MIPFSERKCMKLRKQSLQRVARFIPAAGALSCGYGKNLGALDRGRAAREVRRVRRLKGTLRQRGPAEGQEFGAGTDDNERSRQPFDGQVLADAAIVLLGRLVRWSRRGL
jgi:hypothetical protein